MRRIMTIITANVILFQALTCIALDNNLSSNYSGNVGFSEINPKYKVHFYNLSLSINFKSKTIRGNTGLLIEKLIKNDTLELSLSQVLTVDSITGPKDKKIFFTRSQNKIFIPTGSLLTEDETYLNIYYHGKPKISSNPPWDGGFTWKTDTTGQPFVGITCQLEGADLWWPCLSRWGNKPDSVIIEVEVPDTLKAISNGVLKEIRKTNHNTTWYKWSSIYPILPYNVTIYIGNYGSFQSEAIHNSDTLKLIYYVLPEHLNIAKEHYIQVNKILSVFEDYFGSYPFPLAGFKIVEAPYLGMEHQTAIGIGDGFKNGDNGFSVLSYDFPFDFTIIHETAHEWWGNSVSAKTINDMWINESFATYSESLIIENIMGYDSASSYIMDGITYLIFNKSPLVDTVHGSIYSTDLYLKGSAIWHTFRSMINNDSKWFEFLKQVQKDYKYKSISTQDLTKYINGFFNVDYTWFFNFYLYQSKLPVLLIKKDTIDQNKVFYKWSNDNFPMPLFLSKLVVNQAYISKDNWQVMEISQRNWINMIKRRYLLNFKLVK